MLHPKRYLITSALPYANGPLHIGHLAGAYISADIYVRFLRLMDKDVVYICGSDENGAAITVRAKKEGVSPQQIIDKYHNIFEDSFKKMGISFDVYHRTSSELHHETAKEFFLDIYDKGIFEEKESEQYFDEKEQQFLADRYIKGTCPKCGYDSAYGDQCEKCGSSLSPMELINPVSTISNETPVLKSTKHWYLPLDKDESWLRKFIVDGQFEDKEHHDPNDWKTHVIGQCKSWLDGGLQPRAMTRDLDWGVDVPEEIPESEGKKLYVWMDAPIGYVSATKEWAKTNNKDWKPYWKDKDTALIHFIGKDNIVFHCLIFPAILKAKGDFILPINVPANQFMNLEGQKISTSKNWAVWVNEYIEDFPEQIDVLRYNLIRNMPEHKDSEFTWKNFQDTNNNELVNNIGNFVNRVIVLTNKFYNGVVPEFDQDSLFEGVWDSEFGGFHETELLGLHDDIQELNVHLRRYDFRGALRMVMEISSKGNQLLQVNEPWKLIKEDPEATKAVINLLLQIVTAMSVIVRPFMPFTSDKIRRILNLDDIVEKGELLELLDDLALGDLLLSPGHKIGEAAHLFTRIEDEVIERQISKLEESKKTVEEPGVINIQTKDNEVKSKVDKKVEVIDSKDIIEYGDFAKLDLRVGEILEAEKVEKSDKLLKLKVDLGYEVRTVVSGIAQHFEPNDVISKKVVVVANLKPRKLMGIESKGMVLMASSADGSLVFVSPENNTENGSEVS
ncbi:MAG: methionine--tRNA ligase [Saprospiraceae bacterium]